MSAQPQLKQEAEPRQSRAQQRNGADDYSTENRVVRLETHWQDIIPSLAKTEDVLRSEQKTSAAIADLRVEVAEIRTLQEAHLRMTEGLKSGQGRIDGALDAIHEIQGKFSYDLRMLDGKIKTQGQQLNDKIEVQSERLNAKIETQEELAKKDRAAMEQRLVAKMDAMGNKLFLRTVTAIAGIIGTAGVILGAIVKFL